MNFILRILVNAAVVYFLALILNGVHVHSFWTAVVFSLVLSFLNALVKPLLIILTLPITILTLGLFLIIINVCIILLAAKLVNGISIDGFFWALVFGFAQSVISSILIKAQKTDD
jgi:putative membrane protein